MTGKDIVLLASTFCIGIIAGFYFYVSVFTPTYGDALNNGDVGSASDFLIEGEMYGACEEDAICGTFQLVNGRNFHYQPYEDAEIEEGVLPVSYKRLLEGSLTPEALVQNTKRSAESGCESAGGGIDYTYVVTRDGKEYTLDTCTTLLSSNVELKENLLSLWSALEDPEGAKAPVTPMPEIGFGSIADFIFDRFHNGPKE
jgi:hypothetical protein